MNCSDYDPLVIPMVEYFNSHGLKTIMSCQGHNQTNMSMFWIGFDSSVTEEDIIKFQRAHLDVNGNFCICGRMNKRYVVGENKVWTRFEYDAATVDAANKDLLRWMLIDKSREKRSKIDSEAQSIVKAEQS